MREKSDDDICFPGDKIPDRSASRNIIVYKNPCLDKRRERKETDGTKMCIRDSHEPESGNFY